MRRAKTRLPRRWALFFPLFIYLFSFFFFFFFLGRLRGGPHGVNHPCQAVDLADERSRRARESPALLSPSFSLSPSRALALTRLAPLVYLFAYLFRADCPSQPLLPLTALHTQFPRADVVVVDEDDDDDEVYPSTAADTGRSVNAKNASPRLSDIETKWGPQK